MPVRREHPSDFIFEPESFDRIISRFGVMFFENSVSAFANLRRAATVGAEMCLFAWRSPAENPFMTTAERAAAPLLPNISAREPDAPGQFAFADAGRVVRILKDAGWADIATLPVGRSVHDPRERRPAFEHPRRG